MTNRVFNPIPRVSMREIQALKRETNSAEGAYLGDGQGNLVVESIDTLNYSLVYFRFPENKGVNDSTNFSLPLRGRAELDVPLQNNFPVDVSIDPVSGDLSLIHI